MGPAAMKSTTHPEAQGQEPEINIDPSSRGSANGMSEVNDRIMERRAVAEEAGRLMAKSHIDGDVKEIGKFREQVIVAQSQAEVLPLPLSGSVKFSETVAAEREAPQVAGSGRPITIHTATPVQVPGVDFAPARIDEPVSKIHPQYHI